jgi:hypothetical protein
MRIVVVYESLFGNTREIATAIAEGVREVQPDAQVACLPLAEASPDAVRSAELLIVGGPTHIRGMTSGLSRKMGLQAEAKKAAAGDESTHEPEPGAEGPGVRDWLHALRTPAKGSLAAAFDTRVQGRMAGGAAPAIARRLHRSGYGAAAEPEGFIVEDTEGPLREGELGRAKDWGARLVPQPAH